MNMNFLQFLRLNWKILQMFYSRQWSNQEIKEFTTEPNTFQWKISFLKKSLKI